MPTQQNPQRIVSPVPPWLKDVEAYLKIREVAGAKGNHPQIVAWLKDVGLRGSMLVDETAWCAAGMHGMLGAAGIKGTGSSMARSYMNWGVPLPAPRMGCVAVYQRPPNPLSGHVTFWICDFGTEFDLCFGANQGNACDFALCEKSLALGYRWPKGIALP